MKPHRLAMTNSLVMHYGLHKQMDVLVPHRATISDMAAFHDEEYLRFLQSVTPDNQVPNGIVCHPLCTTTSLSNT